MIVFMATLEMVDYHSQLIETVLTGKNVKVKKDKGNTSKNDKYEKKSSNSDSELEVDYEQPIEGGLVPVDIEMFSLHGSMPHERRMEVFMQFRKARNGVLICTMLLLIQQQRRRRGPLTSDGSRLLLDRSY
ncbi:hypothetical protein ACJJTC_010080 [Scirpophaga incertulas]